MTQSPDDLPVVVPAAAEAPNPEALALAAVGAVARRDSASAVALAQRLLGSERETLAAVETLAGIVLFGIPRRTLAPGTRIAPVFEVPPDQDASEWQRAVDSATTLLTSIAADNAVLTGMTVRAMSNHALDVLVVLVKAAAARIETFVGLDGDTVDAYYASQR
ncbi:hypothetical protein [Umezawaea beigongshangensis]|uniref:hypothetical protein n=1 Tax=Umezawaea beigongshangensis TaxID=2780383 RepID=UPI0018F1F1D9|nr:hypothetical protein [Umezawaea beigongshangensis]